ncbi:MAG: hypothetical protein IPK58_00410 [Acidobacteria bacterium]|nr:hypothetical protein [Acidobacteriota bacterium]
MASANIAAPGPGSLAFEPLCCGISTSALVNRDRSAQSSQNIRKTTKPNRFCYRYFRYLLQQFSVGRRKDAVFTRIVLLIALAFAAVISCSSAAGDRNWAFGTNGVRKTTFATSGSATAGVFQPDGKFLVIGWQFRSGTGTDFRIVRVGANGALDSSFGSNGVAFVAVSTRDDQALGIALQSDGKIIVVGSSRNSTAISDFAIVRLNENGSLDTSFGINGVAVTSVRPC